MRELEEFQQEIVAQWTEVHKKSMLTLLILLALQTKPMWSKEIEKWCFETSGWEISERGLHRTLKRMNKLGLIDYAEASAPKTGIKRKNYAITEFGLGVLSDIKKSSLKYMQNTIFKKEKRPYLKI